MRLNHAQVVNPSVAVEIEVIDHVPAGVKELLKLRHITRFRKSRSHGVEVQIERQVGIEIGDRHRRNRCMLRRRSSHGRGVHGLHRHYHLCRRRHGPYTGPATSHSEHNCYQE